MLYCARQRAFTAQLLLFKALHALAAGLSTTRLPVETGATHNTHTSNLQRGETVTFVLDIGDGRKTPADTRSLLHKPSAL